MATRKVTESLGVFAIEFGLTRDVLRRILSEAAVRPVGCRSGHPLYALKDVHNAVIGQQQPEQLNPHARYALAKAIKTEDEITVRRGELVESADVEREIAVLFMQVARAFDTSIDTLERDIGIAPRQADRLEHHFDQCREQLYREIIDGKKGRRKAVGKVVRGNRRNSSGTDRGPKSTKRLRKAKSGRRRKNSKN